MFRLPKKFAEQLISHCRAEYPNEACGLLAGKAGEATRVFEMTNAERSPVIYRMEPKEQLRVFNEIEQDNLELVGIYHSHTRSAAYPSATDVQWAYYPEAAYVIVSLAEDPAVLRAFSIVNRQVAEIEMELF